jgi:DmsE family decaheme c-type cytochrome
MSSKKTRIPVPLLVSVLLSSLVFGQAPPKQAEPPPAAPETATAAAYVGSEVCQACHEDTFTVFQKSPHQTVNFDKKHGWDGKACESCHGPGSKHAESGSAEEIRNPKKLRPAATDRLCLTCHLNQPSHSGRIQSGHAKNQVSCTACHSIHARGPLGLVARKPTAINEQCASCHITAWAQFQKPFKHRVPEGAMSCTDCHNPHGSFRPAMTQTFGANEPGCFRCHGDKRGPFTFEHAPVRFESCSTCHESHGSTNPRMLTRQEVRLVCLECHSNLPGAGIATNQRTALGVVPPAFHDLRSPRYRNCTICHQKVHGSHVDRNLLR